MLNTRNGVRSTAESLAHFLKEHYVDDKGVDWTRRNFLELEEFCKTTFGEEMSCSFRNQLEGKYEFLWDFIAYSSEGGIMVAAECEQTANLRGKGTGFKHDFDKLLYVFAPIRLFIIKSRDEEEAGRQARELESFAHGSCRSFNPGSAFLLHCCLWYEKGSRTYIWQSEGEPSPRRTERLSFELLT